MQGPVSDAISMVKALTPHAESTRDEVWVTLEIHRQRGKRRPGQFRNGSGRGTVE